jgi:hypothetical protein
LNIDKKTPLAIRSGWIETDLLEEVLDNLAGEWGETPVLLNRIGT